MKQKITIKQIRLVKVAAKGADLIGQAGDGRYRLLLMKYKQSSGSPVMSCKQLDNSQLEDLLAICESYGWRMPGQPEDFYRKKVATGAGHASFAMQEGIRHLAGDLGWPIHHLHDFIEKMTGRIAAISDLTPKEAFKVVEGLKAIFNHRKGTNCNTIQEIREEMEAVTDDSKSTSAKI
jgi:hypothetical protein